MCLLERFWSERADTQVELSACSLHVREGIVAPAITQMGILQGKQLCIISFFLVFFLQSFIIRGQLLKERIFSSMSDFFFHLTLSLPKSRRQNFRLQIVKKCEVQAISY